MQSLPAAVYTCDAEGRITLYDEAAVALWGKEPSLHHDAWSGVPNLHRPDGSPLSLEESPMGRVLSRPRRRTTRTRVASPRDATGD